jgi:hypothetical protein
MDEPSRFPSPPPPDGDRYPALQVVQQVFDQTDLRALLTTDDAGDCVLRVKMSLAQAIDLLDLPANVAVPPAFVQWLIAGAANSYLRQYRVLAETQQEEVRDAIAQGSARDDADAAPATGPDPRPAPDIAFDGGIRGEGV